MNKLDFFFNCLKDLRTAAVLPSSRYVVDRVLKKIDFENTSTVIEYGAGDGAVTKAVLKRMDKKGKMLAFEPNREFSKYLKRTRDRRMRVISDTAQNSYKYLNGARADLVLASIPFSRMWNRHILLKSISERLNKDGRLIIFQQHTPFGLKKSLQKHFSRVQVEWEPRNVPPCFNFVCEK